MNICYSPFGAVQPCSRRGQLSETLKNVDEEARVWLISRAGREDGLFSRIVFTVPFIFCIPILIY